MCMRDNKMLERNIKICSTDCDRTVRPIEKYTKKLSQVSHGALLKTRKIWYL